MTTPRDPDEILAEWLDHGPTRLPDQTRRAIAVAIPTTTQRRRGRFAPWRFPTMRPIAKAASAALVLAVIAGGTLFAVGSTKGGGAATPSPSPCTKPMSEGTPLDQPACSYRSVSVPAFSVSGVPGSFVGLDTAKSTEIRISVPGATSPNGPATMRIIALDNLMTKPCDLEWPLHVPLPTTPFVASTSGAAPTDFFAWMAANTPLTVGSSPVTIGGHVGLQATFSPTPGSLSDCGFGKGAVFVTELGSTTDAATMCGAHVGRCELFIDDDAGSTRISAVEVGGVLMLVTVQASQDDFNAVIAKADLLIASMRFD